MKPRHLLVLVLLLPLASAGCRAAREATSVESAGLPRAQCPVCKVEGDLACVDVRVLPDTPSVQYQGRTYWFCSEQCRSDFEKHPDRYVGR